MSSKYVDFLAREPVTDEHKFAMPGRVSFPTEVEADAVEETVVPGTPIVIPIDAVARIFSFLTPDELLVAQKVCRSWYNVIKAHPQLMQWRRYDILYLTTNVEFGIQAFSGTKMYRYSTQKYFCDFGTDARESSRSKKLPIEFSYMYPCGTPFHPNIPRYFSSMEVFQHSRQCNQRVHWRLPFLQPDLHSKPSKVPKDIKLYTPPQRYYEKLNEMTKYSHVDTVCLGHYSLTMTTGYMIQKYCKPFELQNLVLHNTSCKGINAEEFQKVLTEVFPAKHYSFEGVKKVQRNHFNANWLNHPTTIQAESIRFTVTLSRFKSIPACFIKFGFSEAELIAFLTHPDAPQNRDVFQFHVVNVDFQPGFEQRLQRCTREYCKTGFRKIVLLTDTDAFEHRRQSVVSRHRYFYEQKQAIDAYRAQHPDSPTWGQFHAELESYEDE